VNHRPYFQIILYANEQKKKELFPAKPVDVKTLTHQMGFPTKKS
jgi:hypothetical protein